MIQFPIIAAAALGIIVGQASAQQRDWGGLWLGIGAGAKGNQYGGALTIDDDFCVTSSAFTSGAQAQAQCQTTPEGVQAQVQAQTPDAQAEAQSATQNAGGVAQSQTQTQAQVIGSGQAQAQAQAQGSNGSTYTGANALVENGVPGAAAFALADGINPQTQAQAQSQPQAVAPGLASGSAFAYADVGSGVYAAASEVRAESGGESTEVVALGFAGLDLGNASAEDSAIAGGVHARYDRQFGNNVVAGLEVEFVGSDASTTLAVGEVFDAPDGASSSDSDPDDFDPFDAQSAGASAMRSIDVDAHHAGSVRVRLGYAAGNVLTYVTGGVAVGHFEASFEERFSVGDIEVTSQDSGSVTAFGGVGGGGVAAFLGDRTVVGIEGLYYHFNDSISFGNSTSVEIEDSFSVMVKLSFRVH